MTAPPACPAAAGTHACQHLLPDAAVVQAVHDGVEHAGGEQEECGSDLWEYGLIRLLN